MPLTSLTELANHHGSDKGTLGPTDGWPGHNYTDVYEFYRAIPDIADHAPRDRPERDRGQVGHQDRRRPEYGRRLAEDMA